MIDYFEFHVIENQKIAFFYSKGKQVVSFVFNSVYMLGLNVYFQFDSNTYLLIKEHEIEAISDFMRVNLESHINTYRALRLLLDTNIGKEFKL